MRKQDSSATLFKKKNKTTKNANKVLPQLFDVKHYRVIDSKKNAKSIKIEWNWIYMRRKTIQYNFNYLKRPNLKCCYFGSDSLY